MAAAVRYLLDTNIVSYIVCGPSHALAARLVAVPMTQLCVSSVTEGELFYGLARRPGATALHTVVEAFLKRVDVLAWDSVAARRYGTLRAALETAGTPMGNLDMLIAAHALSTGAILVTNDLPPHAMPFITRKSGVARLVDLGDG